MNIILSNIIIILFSCLALALGASWLVDSAARLARHMGISELVIGLTIVAFGTSAPEFSVTISSALTGNPNISVGNIVGSNIFNIGFILGGCVLFVSLKTRPSLVWRDCLLLLAVTVLLLLFLLNLTISRWEGIVLFALLVGYLVFLFWKREPMMADDGPPIRSATWRDWPMLLLGLLLIIGGGYFLKDSAEKLARIVGLSEWVIAVTVVAAGTSVPEFVISMIALIKKHHGISAGNLIGSNLFNTLGVLGLAGVIHPLAVEKSALFSIGGLAVLTLVVLVFMRTGWKLSRREGIVLLLISLGIWACNFLFASPVVSPE
jgi:cation:H+ antiporter